MSGEHAIQAAARALKADLMALRYRPPAAIQLAYPTALFQMNENEAEAIVVLALQRFGKESPL